MTDSALPTKTASDWITRWIVIAIGVYSALLVMPYAEVASKNGHEEATAVEGASGRVYLMVKRIRWSHRRSRAVQVMASINDETDQKDLLSLRWHLIRRPDEFHADSLS